MPRFGEEVDDVLGKVIGTQSPGLTPIILTSVPTGDLWLIIAASSIHYRNYDAPFVTYIDERASEQEKLARVVGRRDDRYDVCLGNYVAIPINVIVDCMVYARVNNDSQRQGSTNSVESVFHGKFLATEDDQLRLNSRYFERT